jgi:hypothetical protein
MLKGCFVTARGDGLNKFSTSITMEQLSQSSPIQSPPKYKNREDKNNDKKILKRLVSNTGSSRSSGFVPSPPRKVLADLCHCRSRCYLNFTSHWVEEVRVKLKSKTKELQNIFLLQHTEQDDDKHAYYFPAPAGLNKQVCKQFYLRAFKVGAQG